MVNYITPTLCTLQMADMYSLYQAAGRVGVDYLIKGMPYWIIAAQKCIISLGIRLILKLRAHPHNIYVMMPNYCTGVLQMSQIDRTNREKLFVNFAYWGWQPSGNPIIQLRNTSVPMPTYAEMLAAGAVGY